MHHALQQYRHLIRDGNSDSSSGNSSPSPLTALSSSQTHSSSPPSSLAGPRHIRHFLAATSLACLLSACVHIDAGNGVEFRYERLKELHSGMSIAQVENLLGKPLSIEKTAQETIYGYNFGNVKAFRVLLVGATHDFENATARLVFQDQTLQSFSYEITEPKK